MAYFNLKIKDSCGFIKDSVPSFEKIFLSVLQYPYRRAFLAAVLRQFYENGQKEKAWNRLDYRLFWRKRWDSNPRALADNRISSAARYDHFDTLPYSLLYKVAVPGSIPPTPWKVYHKSARGSSKTHRKNPWKKIEIFFKKVLTVYHFYSIVSIR